MRMKMKFPVWAIPLAAIVWAVPTVAAASSCESLTALHPANTTVTLAESVAAGAITSPTTPSPVTKADLAASQLSSTALPEVPLADLPAFCRVVLAIKPSSDSNIKVEVWMPASGWNGKFMAVGNGGWGGAISYKTMGAPLSRGYATASTDTGHDSSTPGGTFSLGHPEKLIDFGYRAIHEMTVASKAVIAAYYGSAAKFTYFDGCSTGGRQGLKDARLFPGDFDGMVAGAPVGNHTHISADFIFLAQAAHKNEASYIPPAKYPMIHAAVVDACDTLDDIKDGVIENPLLCKFDPQTLECKGADAPNCLTAPQVQLARTIYSGTINPRTKEVVYPGLMPGSEMGWAVGAGPQVQSIANDFFKYVVYKEPNWNYMTFTFDDLAKADKEDNGDTSGPDPDLRPFFARGGKLFEFHGWSDNQMATLDTIHFYESAQKLLGGPAKGSASYRLFMVPGMGHCRGGDGVTEFDSIGAIEQWVEKSKAPDQIVASRVQDGKTVRTRPLCPYPQTAAYTGTGSTDDAKNFVCRNAK